MQQRGGGEVGRTRRTMTYPGINGWYEGMGQKFMRVPDAPIIVVPQATRISIGVDRIQDLAEQKVNDVVFVCDLQGSANIAMLQRDQLCRPSWVLDTGISRPKTT